jgi:hypothetical protein
MRVPAPPKTQKKVRLTCQCGVPYTLHTISDLRGRCMNERCRAPLNMNPEDLWEYQESIVALMATVGLGRDYEKELVKAKKVSKKLASPYTIDIIEIA